MRIITKKSVEAFLNKEPFKLNNTEIKALSFEGSGDELEILSVGMILHGSLIATNDGDGNIQITNAGYPTRVTRERLNSIPGVSVKKIKGIEYLNGEAWDGKWKII